MAGNTVDSTAHSMEAAPASTYSSTATTDKYPVESSHNNYPELAPSMTQPPLQAYQYVNKPYGQEPYQYQNAEVRERGEPTLPSHKTNPWGLSPLFFGILVATITAIIVGGAVGGGVAGAMSGKDSGEPASTVTVTASGSPATTIRSATSTSGLPLPSSLRDFTAPEPYYVGTLANPGCAQGNSVVQGPYGHAFDLFCGVDMSNKLPDDNSPDLMVADFTGLFAYSITDCLYACANAIHFTTLWGQDHPGGNMQSCKGVVWNYQMAKSNSSDNANCWLKNGTSNGYQCNTCISAKLVQ